MKIAFLTKMRMPEERGIAFALAMMCQSFAKLGWETSLVAPKRRQPQSLRKETVWSYFQVKSAVFKVAFLPSFELPWGTPGEPIFSHLRYFVMSWLFSFAAVWHLTLHKYEVVYLFPDCKELLVILRFWPFCKSFVVHEVHHPPYERYLQIYDKLGVPRTDLIVGNTQSNASYYARNGVIENKAIGAHVGVSLEDYDYQTPKSQLRRKLKLPVSKTIIGFGGRFVALGMEKGISELIIAFSRLRKKYKNIYLACVGGPDTYVSKYIKEARNLGLANSDFAILDGVPLKILYQYLRAFDVCVMTYPWTEHFAHNMSPLKLFEYMASKNPIVTTALPVINEVLVDRRDAIFVKPSNAEDMARGIGLLIKNPILAAKISGKAFEEVSSHYTWMARAKRISDAIASRYTGQFLAK